MVLNYNLNRVPLMLMPEKKKWSKSRSSFGRNFILKWRRGQKIKVGSQLPMWIVTYLGVSESISLCVLSDKDMFSCLRLMSCRSSVCSRCVYWYQVHGEIKWARRRKGVVQFAAHESKGRGTIAVRMLSTRVVFLARILVSVKERVAQEYCKAKNEQVDVTD